MGKSSVRQLSDTLVWELCVRFRCCIVESSCHEAGAEETLGELWGEHRGLPIYRMTRQVERPLVACPMLGDKSRCTRNDPKCGRESPCEPREWSSRNNFQKSYTAKLWRSYPEARVIDGARSHEADRRPRTQARAIQALT